MNLLLLSNSTNSGDTYLNWPRPFLSDFISANHIKTALFFPYAGVNLAAGSLTDSYDAYLIKVQNAFNEYGVKIFSAHQSSNIEEDIKRKDAIFVGGGNTFHLFFEMHLGSMELVRNYVLAGKPFIGWSAGSNIACPTLMTTNDMPIKFPGSFAGLNLVPFQINPHYLDAHPEGHGGETRQQRIEEFLTVNRNMTVVGLREGTLLEVNNDQIYLRGKHPMRWFNYSKEPIEYQPGDDIRFLLK